MSYENERQWYFYFEKNDIVYDATLRNLELIGEAATHVPEDVRENFPDIPWRKIIATRNRVIHGYLGIDNDVLWSILKQDIPLLLLQLNQAKNSMDKIQCKN
jgi:uncharacterized protein with HEPN domain